MERAQPERLSKTEFVEKFVALTEPNIAVDETSQLSFIAYKVNPALRKISNGIIGLEVWGDTFNDDWCTIMIIGKVETKTGSVEVRLDTLDPNNIYIEVVFCKVIQFRLLGEFLYKYYTRVLDFKKQIAWGD